MDTLLLCGGPLEEVFCLNVIEKLQPDCIIGIDRGLDFCYRNQIHPDYILGDFDSIDKEILDYYENQSEIPVKRYKPEKDATDTRIGLELAINLGSSRVFLLGATGGRLDHYMGNLQSLTAARREGVEAWILDSRNALTVLDKPAVFLLGATGGRLDHYMGNLQSLTAARREGVEAWILDSRNALTVLDKPAVISRKEQFGTYISFFSMSDQVEGLTLTGFKYPLHEYTMTNFDGIGVSNEIQEETAKVEFSKGLVLMVMSRD